MHESKSNKGTAFLVNEGTHVPKPTTRRGVNSIVKVEEIGFFWGGSRCNKCEFLISLLMLQCVVTNQPADGQLGIIQRVCDELARDFVALLIILGS